MMKEIKIILQSLNNQNHLISSMGKQTVRMLEGQEDVNLFIDNLKNEIKLGYDLHGDHRPFYYFYLSIGYLALDDSKKAKESLANAVQGFQVAGFSLNEALGEWLFAIIHFQDGNHIRAQQACEAAVLILRKLIQLCNERSQYENASTYNKYLKQIESLLKLIKRSPPAEVEGTAENHLSPSEEDYIILPWLPKYDAVRAGTNGLIWADPPTEKSAVIHTIEIDGISCQVFSTISSAKAKDHQITLVPGMDYGWAKVEGHSMNASRPVPIEEGDYVLFTKQWHEDQNAIVLASHVLAENKNTYMVKKYIAKNCDLVSETTDTSQDYSPIHLNEQYQILGTVIAVAKPKN